MQRRKLGHSGLEVTPLFLGGNVFGWTMDDAASFAVLDAYLEAGGNSIDTADVGYGKEKFLEKPYKLFLLLLHLPSAFLP